MTGMPVWAGEARTVRGGEIVVDVVRGPCPESHRPCGDECPFVREEHASRHVLRPEPRLLHAVFDRLYCKALLDGTVEWRCGGVATELSVELEPSEGDADDARPVRSLRMEVEGLTREIAVSDLARPIQARVRAEDARRHGRTGRDYRPTVVWRAGTFGEESPIRGRRPSSQVGRDVLRGRVPSAGVRRLALDHPETQDGSSPMTEVVWRDLAGLGLARRAAAAEREREIAFFLLGSMAFDPERKAAYTTVERVVPVEEHEYLRSDAVRCAVGPEAFARARGIAKAEGLCVVGILHSHCLEMAQRAEPETELPPAEAVPLQRQESDSPGPSGLFYSATDQVDHDRLFPSAWSIGGVLNVRPSADGKGDVVEVQTAIFARTETGAFAPLDTLIIPETWRSP